MQRSQDEVSCGSSVARLYELHAATIFAYLRRQTSSREDAEDILVEVFAAAVEASTFERLGEKEQVVWLWRVALNKAVDAYRRSRLRQGTDLETVADVIYDDGEHAPEQIALQREEYAQLHAHLEKLTPMQREAVRLRFANDLRCSEIAAVLGKREGAVRVLLSRALNFLRTLYEDDPGRTHS